jgi:hypothetical protein
VISDYFFRAEFWTRHCTVTSRIQAPFGGASAAAPPVASAGVALNAYSIEGLLRVVLEEPKLFCSGLRRSMRSQKSKLRRLQFQLHPREEPSQRGPRYFSSVLRRSGAQCCRTDTFFPGPDRGSAVPQLVRSIGAKPTHNLAHLQPKFEQTGCISVTVFALLPSKW